MNYYVESVFEHAGFECVVILTCMGHRDGYVGIPKTHPLYGVDYFDDRLDDIDVHGGLTYSNGNPEYPIATDGELWWFGFDCAHCYDDIDYDAVKRELPEHLNEIFCHNPYEGATTKSQEYVESECRKLAKQLKDWRDD